jgi:hypothetical protein
MIVNESQWSTDQQQKKRTKDNSAFIESEYTRPAKGSTDQAKGKY